MKKIIKWLVIIVAVGVLVKVLTGRTIGERMLDRQMAIVETNTKSKVGETIFCPMCGKSFEKDNEAKIFDTIECRDKYEKLVNKVDTEKKFITSTENVVNAVKDAVSNEINNNK